MWEADSASTWAQWGTGREMLSCSLDQDVEGMGLLPA